MIWEQSPRVLEGSQPELKAVGRRPITLPLKQEPEIWLPVQSRGRACQLFNRKSLTEKTEPEPVLSTRTEEVTGRGGPLGVTEMRTTGRATGLRAANKDKGL